MKKARPCYAYKTDKDGNEIVVPMNRAARRAFAKKAGEDWAEAKNYKKNKPLKTTLTGHAAEEDIVEV